MQYQQSMARMMGGLKKEVEDGAQQVEQVQQAQVVMDADATTTSQLSQYKEVVQDMDMPQFAEFLRTHGDYILRIVLPVIWTILLVVFLDRESFIRTIYMPFIGVFAATLANCIPLGGGIVYVPLLSLLGAEIHLSVAFTVATMTIGNGCFGFLQWLLKDPTLIVWESFVFTVLPCSLGSAFGILLVPPLDSFWVKKIFGAFCLLVAAYVALLAHAHGSEERSGPTTRPAPSRHQWVVVVIVFFLSGVVLVTNIGIGPALIAYFMLGDNYLGYSQKQAIVTGIITGGWVSAVPFFLHTVVLGDVPVKLWIMVLPGVYAGALLAPRVYEAVGLKIIFSAFSVFLVLSAVMFLW